MNIHNRFNLDNSYDIDAMLKSIIDQNKKYIPYLKEKYNKSIKYEVMKELNIKNVHCIPKIQKIIISASISNLNPSHNNELLKKIYNALFLMTGVRPIYTKATRSISQFKIYKGMVTGAKSVLRGDCAYEFAERLCHTYLPNLKGFRGISINSINGSSVNIGIDDAYIVSEIVSYLGVLRFGFNVDIVVSQSHNKEHIFEVLKRLDFPMRKDI